MLDVESMYTNINHAKGLQTSIEVMTRCPLYDSAGNISLTLTAVHIVSRLFGTSRLTYNQK